VAFIIISVILIEGSKAYLFFCHHNTKTQDIKKQYRALQTANKKILAPRIHEYYSNKKLVTTNNNTHLKGVLK